MTDFSPLIAIVGFILGCRELSKVLGKKQSKIKAYSILFFSSLILSFGLMLIGVAFQVFASEEDGAKLTLIVFGFLCIILPWVYKKIKINTN